MAVKQIHIRVPGGNLDADVPLNEWTTASDALEAVGLSSSNYVLQTSDGDGIFQPSDRLDGHADDGELLYAVPWAKVGAVPVAPLLIALVAGGTIILLLLLASAATCQAPAPSAGRHPDSVEDTPLWKRRGWHQTGDTYRGAYRVGALRLPGAIMFRSPWDSAFTVDAPDSLVGACGEHSRCFFRQGRSNTPGRHWYGVHFVNPPPDIDSAILGLELLLGHAEQRLSGASE